jgi:SAM-dependent methyltransferase
MDRTTLAAYDQDAAAFAKEWEEQPAPVDLHDVVTRFFIRGGRTGDIGCGSGREAAWLNANGFPAEGFDASDGLLEEARRRHPSLKFTHAELPALSAIASGSFDNVLCETVIMHLAPELIAPSVARMLDITRTGGILYISWRVTEAADLRDARGRLYSAFDADVVRFELKDAAMLLDEEVVSTSSAKKVRRLVVRKVN